MRAPRIEVMPKSFATLMADFGQGRIRVPRFQREFVWERSRILKLLDSMFEEYPIGTIFLWNAPSEYNHLIRNIEDLGQPPLKGGQDYQLILDGQQRLTSLYVVIQGLSFEGEDYRKIVVDLEADSGEDSPFRYRIPDDQRWVSVSNLLSGDFGTYENLPSTEHKRRFAEINEALKNYPFSVVTVTERRIDDAIEIFERINQQGRKLSRYDLICASVMTEDFDLREKSQEDIIDRLKPNFGEIEETSIPQALALNKKGRTEHSTQIGLTTEDILDVWDTTVVGFGLAVEFVKRHMGVARKDFLPYDAMLPVLVHYFFHADAHVIQSFEQRKQLEYWFWRSAFSQRYSGASQTRMTEDASWIRQLVGNETHYMHLNVANENDLISASMRSTTSAIRNGILCLLNSKRPRHFKNRMETNLGTDHFFSFTRAEKHHIFPAGFLREKGYALTRVHSIPNFCFIPAELNQWIGDKSPSVYVSEIRDSIDDINEFERVMLTHLIPVDSNSGIWTDDYELFLRQRARLLVQEIRQLCGITARVESEMRDPVVNRIEIALRDYIHHTLLAHGSDYWKRFVTSDVQKRVETAIDRYIGKTPGTKKRGFDDPRIKLDHCDVSDYAKIITSKPNWTLFAGVFKNEEETRRVLEDFREYRAAIKHNRDVDAMLDHRAQAAFLWLRSALELDLSEFGI